MFVDGKLNFILVDRMTCESFDVNSQCKIYLLLPLHSIFFESDSHEMMLDTERKRRETQLQSIAFQHAYLDLTYVIEIIQMSTIRKKRVAFKIDEGFNEYLVMKRRSFKSDFFFVLSSVSLNKYNRCSC